ncbi:MoxR family ATPase [uncultured Salinisphaera sp.]|uniref:AAA family ATPase n=1 Tax=uncultured Salinisphaera sp. TaxID=359372 RepID=UPI0032B152C4
MSDCLASPEALTRALSATGYIADDELATTLYLAAALARPVLVEGPAGVGKTAIAQALGQALGASLHRLQCYEGLDASQALYDWDYPRQFMAIRLAEAADTAIDAGALYSERYLLARPILAALSEPQRAVLLIDELDRADEAFEALLLEVLADWQITIPEYRTIRAAAPPLVVITGNRTRELSDAVRRRCLYAWIDYPEPAHERAVLAARLPGIDNALAEQITQFVARVRALDLAKTPGLSESLDWARALITVGATDLAHERVPATLAALVKDPGDIEQLAAHWQSLIDDLAR